MDAPKLSCAEGHVAGDLAVQHGVRKWAGVGFTRPNHSPLRGQRLHLETDCNLARESMSENVTFGFLIAEIIIFLGWPPIRGHLSNAKWRDISAPYTGGKEDEEDAEEDEWLRHFNVNIYCVT